jgi:hypothetical protein
MVGAGNQLSACAGPHRVVRVEVRLLDPTVVEVVGDALLFKDHGISKRLSATGVP